MLDLSKRCQKYIILGRRQTIKNLDGEDRTKLISEIYCQIKGTASDEGGITEYRRCYYREIIGGRGIDTYEMESGQTYLSIDRSLGDFIELNFSGQEAVEINEILKFRTYKNRNFIKRNRNTTFHEELDVIINKNGKVKTKSHGKK
jgi:hypothetical protein